MRLSRIIPIDIVRSTKSIIGNAHGDENSKYYRYGFVIFTASDSSLTGANITTHILFPPFLPETNHR